MKRWSILIALSLFACGGGGNEGGDALGGGGASGPHGKNGETRGGPNEPSSLGGIARWSSRLGGALGDMGRAVAADGQGNVVVVGTFDGAADLGGVTMQ